MVDGCWSLTPPRRHLNDRQRLRKEQPRSASVATRLRLNDRPRQRVGFYKPTDQLADLLCCNGCSNRPYPVLRRGAPRLRPVDELLSQARGLRADHGDPATDAVRTGRLAHRAAAFTLDHGDGTGQPGLVERILSGDLTNSLTRDDLLDNITLYWLTNTGVSASRLYWENEADFFDAKNITIPVRHQRLSRRALPGSAELGRARLSHNLIHCDQLDRGGHFAAWEEPELFSSEMRAAFRSLRTIDKAR
jgi:pimeloyl-ACP methyl ester carboxylesterase